MEKRNRNILFIALAAIFVVVVVVVVVFISRALVCNATSHDGQAHTYYVYPDTPMDSVLLHIQQDYRIHSMLNLHLVARHMGLKTPVAGHYRFPAKCSSRSLVSHLVHGWQAPVSLSFTNQIRNREQLSARLGSVLLLDSAEVMARLDSAQYLEQFGLNRETAVCLFIPNTYEVYWTISVDDLFQRMYAEYRRFWNEERLSKAHQRGLTPTEVATLASIVESETNRKVEHPTIASLYLNRLRKGMALQACPTVIFANGDFSVHRVTGSMLRMDSPYNTYKYRGLPPGPIRLPNGAGMDAVLDAPETNYLYMCANPDWSGTHVFSATFAEHSRVGAAYRRELNRRNIH